MICVLRMHVNEIDGWIIATDIQDARNRAIAHGQMELAKHLHSVKNPSIGRTDLPGGYVMLVQP